ncbi:hypothetical protein YC2023_009596 [Brassica napus]
MAQILEGMEPDLVTDPSGKKEEDVVPPETENIRGVDKRGAMVFFGSGNFGELNKLVGVITRDALITSPEKKVCEDQTAGEEHESMEETAAEAKGDVGETEVEKATINEDKDEAVEKEAVWRDVVEDSGGSEGLENEADEEKGDVAQNA